MGLLLFIFVITFAVGAADDSHPPCGPTDWFLYNLRNSIYQPIIDSLSYVTYAAPAMISQRNNFPHPCTVCDAFDKTQHEECGAIGIQGGMDVLHVLFKIYSGGFTLPWLPFVTPLAQNATYLFDICTEHTSKYELDKLLVKEAGGGAVKLFERECFRASRLFQCATFNLNYLLPWIIGMVIVFLVGFVLPMTMFGLWYCC